MKVILLDNVKKRGLKYDIKDVASGHARNLLIPNGLAMPATKENIKSLDKKKARLAQENQVREDLLIESLKSLKSEKIEIIKKATQEGHLFEGIGVEEILKVLFEKKNIVLSSDNLKFDKPIKSIGEVKIPVSVGDHTSGVLISVVPEN